MRLLEAEHPTAVHTLCFSPDGLMLLAAQGRSGRVLRWGLEDFTPLPPLPTHFRRITGIVCSAEVVAVASAGGGVRAWRLEDVSARAWELGVMTGRFGPFPSLAFTPDGRWLFCTHDTYRPGWQRPPGPNLLEALSGRVVEFPPPGGALRGHYPASHSAFSPDGSRVALCFSARDVAVQAFPSGEHVLTLHHGGKANLAAYGPDGRALATASPDGLMRVWDIEAGRQRAQLKGQAKPLHGIAWSPEGRTLAAACGQGTVTLWDVQTGRARAALDWGIGEVHSVAFAPDGMRAAAGGMGRIMIWDIDDWGA